MKKFKQLFETGNSADDFKVKDDNEDEGTGEKSSASGEEKFKKLHKTDKKKHPTADDAVFQGKTKKAERYVDGEKKPLKTYKEMKEDICKIEEDDIEIDLSVSDDEEEISEGLLNDLKKNSLVLNDRKKTKVKLSPADSKALTNAYGKLNSANKKKFEAELMKDKMSFETMLDFAKQT